MKKTTVIISLLLITSFMLVKAQESLGLTHRHELKLNLLTSVFAFPEVSYEYILSNDITLGAAMRLGFDKEDGIGFNTIPFVRWFLRREDQQPATGLFLEVNAALGTQYVFDIKTTFEKEAMFAAGVGLAVGCKYLWKNNWTGELFLGLGNNFIYDKEIESNLSEYLRIGLCIGKRF